jgi:hypothetical protein
MAEKWTKTSLLLSAGVMKPKPFSLLNPFGVSDRRQGYEMVDPRSSVDRWRRRVDYLRPAASGRP